MKRKRNRPVQIYFNDDEYKILKEKSIKAGVNVSKLVRSMLQDTSKETSLELMNTLTDIQMQLEELIYLLQSNDPGSEEAMTELLERYLYLEQVVLDNLEG